MEFNSVAEEQAEDETEDDIWRVCWDTAVDWGTTPETRVIWESRESAGENESRGVVMRSVLLPLGGARSRFSWLRKPESGVLFFREASEEEEVPFRREITSAVFEDPLGLICLLTGSTRCVET